MQGASIRQQNMAAVAAKRSGGYRQLGTSLLNQKLKKKGKHAVRDENTGQFVLVAKPKRQK